MDFPFLTRVYFLIWSREREVTRTGLTRSGDISEGWKRSWKCYKLYNCKLQELVSFQKIGSWTGKAYSNSSFIILLAFRYESSRSTGNIRFIVRMSDEEIRDVFEIKPRQNSRYANQVSGLLRCSKESGCRDALKAT